MHPRPTAPHTRRVRRNRALTFLAATCLVTPLLTAAVSPDATPASATVPDDTLAVQPTNSPPAQAPLELDEPATVTLITGDEVTVHLGNRVSIKPADGRDHIDFEEINDGATVRVVPADAQRLLAEDKLDERLFDVSYLVREGYADRDTLPLIVEGDGRQIEHLAAGPDAAVTYESDQLQLSAVEQDRAAVEAPLWSRMTSDGTTAPKLPDGVDKIWLDAMAHITLDQSVPHIGAPEVWESGYTGEGVTVAVLDTGIDTTHPDLAGKVADTEVFTEVFNAGRFDVAQLNDPVSWIWLTNAGRVPIEGVSDPLVYVGRACVDSEGDELLADPAGKTALIARDQDACTFAEKFDAVVEAGATGVVIYNDEPGIVRGTLQDAEHGDAAWGANISDIAGVTLIDLLDSGEQVVLEFTDQPLIGDLHGHGTHVASTIAGTGAASDGARKGVAPDATLLSGQICNDRGSCPTSAVLAGMEWAANADADIISMSIGGGVSDGTDPMSQAVNSLTESHDVLFVVAAGNSGIWGNGAVGAPGAADAALTVGASDRHDAIASFSSRGPRIRDNAVKPNVVAPGVDIVAARARGTTLGTPVDDVYVTSSGTSMATPHVASAAALLAQARPELDAAALKDALASTAVDLGHQWFDQGNGLVDVARAVSQGVHADASINLGTVKHGSAPIERDLTYTNRTNRVVKFTLNASLTALDGTASTAIDLSRKRVTVPAHSSRTVTVAIDPAADDIRPGPYGGVVTASGNGVRLRTAVGLGIDRAEPPLEPDWDAEWTATYHYAHGDYPGWANGMRLKDAEASPDNTQLFLFGSQSEAGDGAKLTTAAIDAATGDEIWVAHQPVPEVTTGSRIGNVAVSPDGDMVVVTHDIWHADDQRRDSLILAYNNAVPQHRGDPALGELLWRATYPDIGLNRFFGTIGVMRIAITPDSETVVMAATVALSENDFEFHTIALDASSGDVTWTSELADTARNYYAMDLAISPASDLVYVTGFEQPDLNDFDASPITIAYQLQGDAAGTQRWIARSDSTTGNYSSWHNTVSADGERVFVAATAEVGDTLFDERMLTLAIDADSGAELWSHEFAAGDHGYSPGHTQTTRWTDGGIVADSDNDRLFVVGKHCEGGQCHGRKATVVVAYDQASGEMMWFDLADVQSAGSFDGSDFLSSAAVSPDGERLYVSGSIGPWRSWDHLAMAYDTTTGERLAVARHEYSEDGVAAGLFTFLSPSGDFVYTVGSVFPNDGFAYWTLAAHRSPIALAADAQRTRGNWHVNLSWSGTTADQVDVYRDDEMIDTLRNTGLYVDDLGHQRQGTSVTYQVCAAGTNHCSKETTVTIE